jgi:uncharacterized protein
MRRLSYTRRVTKTQTPSPYRADKLDVRQFARDQATLQGQNSLHEFERLREEAFGLGDAALSALQVTWLAEGVWKALRGGAAETRLRLQARLEIPLQCQRCLGPVQECLEVDREFLFVSTEAQAEELDDSSDVDVLVASKAFDLLELVEDELLMALPLVARHPECDLPG